MSWYNLSRSTVQALCNRWALMMCVGLVSFPSHSRADEANTKGLTLERAPEAASLSTLGALRSPREARRIAILIGVNQYEQRSVPSLSFAEADARALAEVLRDPQRGHFDQVDLLESDREQLSRRGILERLKLYGGSSLEEQDTLLVYFSGHGVLGRNELDEPALFLLPTDADPEQLPETAIDLEQLRRFFEGTRAGRKALIIDACFTGLGKSGARPQLGESETLELALSRAQRRFSESEALLMASRVEGASLEFEALGHGAYTYYLLEALTRPHLADLDGDRALTAYEAHNYSSQQVMDYTHLEQVPALWMRSVGDEQIYLLGERNPVQRSDLALLDGHAPGTRANLTVKVDGEVRGITPRAIPVTAGRHLLEVLDPEGAVVLVGALKLLPGDVYSLRRLRDEIAGERRLLELRLGGQLSLWGPGSLVWGDVGPTLAVSSALKVRTGWLRGLTLGASAAWGRSRLEPVAVGGESLIRHRGSVAVELGWRWQEHRLQRGITVSQAVLLSPEPAGVADLMATGETLPGGLTTWVAFPTCLGAWQGLKLDQGLLVTAREGLTYTSGTFAHSFEAGHNLQLELAVGLELAF